MVRSWGSKGESGSMQHLWSPAQYPFYHTRSISQASHRTSQNSKFKGGNTWETITHHSKFSKPGFSNTWTMNSLTFKLFLEKAEIKLPTSPGSLKKKECSRKNIYFCFIDYAKAFDCVDHHKLWKILKEMGIPDHLTCLLRNLYAG